VKRGRKCKYKTAAEKKSAHLAAVKKWALKNRDKIKENYKKHAKKNIERTTAWRKKNPKKAVEYSQKYYAKLRDAYKQKFIDQFPAFEQRIAKLENEVKEILLTLEEVSKEQRRLSNLDKWGKK